MSRSLPRFAWSVLTYNLAVIAWGAYVRATGSGAGCGAHWPLCNGEVVPRAPSVEMLIEFSHRVSSGLALASVVALAVWTRRALPTGHPARRGAAGALVFMLTEAAVGAGLVLFRLVADNATMARAMFMSVHLANTFVLLAFLSLTAYWLSGGGGLQVRRRGAMPAWLLAGAAALMSVGISGAIAALGDTLSPAGSLAQGLAADLSPASHLLIRLRVVHPALATGVGCLVLAASLALRRSPVAGPAARVVALLAILQLAAGLTNVLLLAPVWMQIVHLALADLTWIALVMLAARTLSSAPAAAEQPGRVLAQA